MFQQIERNAAQVNPLAYKLTKAQQTRKPTNSETHQVANPQTH